MTQADVVAALKEHGELTKDEIAEHANANPHTIAQSIVRLKHKHDIEEVPIRIKRRGPPIYKYRLKEGEGE